MQVLWGILDLEQPDTQTMNNIVMSSVELIYCYAECLALHGKDTGKRSVAPAVELLKKLLFSANEAVQTSSRYCCLVHFSPKFPWQLLFIVFNCSFDIQLGHIIKIASSSISKADYISCG